MCSRFVPELFLKKVLVFSVTAVALRGRRQIKWHQRLHASMLHFLEARQTALMHSCSNDQTILCGQPVQVTQTAMSHCYICWNQFILMDKAITEKPFPHIHFALTFKSQWQAPNRCMKASGGELKITFFPQIWIYLTEHYQ